MKILVAQFKQETNTFSNVKCGLDRFKESYYAYGKELFIELKYKATELGGMLNALQKEEVDIIPSLAMHSCSGGPVKKEAYKHFKDIIFEDIDNNLPLDGICLCLHGATVFEDEEDGMGKLLLDIRNKVGEKVKIAASLDYHANITKKMIESSDILRGFRKYPHIDLYETGFDTAKMLIKAIKGETNPKMIAFKIPMINQAEGSPTTSGAMAELYKMARNAEEREDILSISYFQMQPWLDIYDAGCSIIAIGNNDFSTAKKYGEKFAKFMWDKKDTFKTKLASMEEILDIAEKSSDIIVFSDSADAPSAGATGDSNIVLKYLLDKKIKYKTYLCIVDPETVQKAIKVGIGNTSTFTIGGKIYTNLFTPVEMTGNVKLISDGDYVVEGAHSKGKLLNMGKAVVIQNEKIFVLVMENPTPISDPGPYLSVGLDPAKAKLIMVKSPNQFKSTFNKYTDKLIQINTPGASASYFWELPYKNLRRPIYPFDSIDNYKPEILAKGYRVK